jgi:CheY-like chemotaxis protein
MSGYHLVMVIVGVDDLLFQSRIRAAAQAMAAPITFVRHYDALITALRETSPALLILDLDCDAIQAIAVIRDVRSSPELAGIALVGYASHVHADRLQAARDAGCDRVLARSGFVKALPELIRSATGRSDA